MKEYPILFKGDMVRAILEGRKTETRRIVKPTVKGCTVGVYTTAGKVMLNDVVNVQEDGDPWTGIKCPYGQVGDRLWVRETWADTSGENGPMISYRAKGGCDRFLVNESYPVDYSLYPKCNFTMWCTDLRSGAKGHNWRPSIFMPRWASRITLEIIEISVERVQDMDNDNAISEGINEYWIDYDDGGGYWNVPALWTNPDGKIIKKIQTEDPIEAFSNLWDSINKKRGFGWDSNPWVWVVKFKRVEE